MAKKSNYADLFWGNGAVAAPAGKGLAKHWNWLKAQTGNTHPGALMPFGWVSALPFSGAYPTGYGVNGNSCEGTPPQVSDGSYAWGVTHFHHSGTGYVGEFYNYFLVQALSAGCDGTQISELCDEHAQPGYFSGKLVDYDVDFELTCGKYTAFHRYYFGADSGKVNIDITQLGLKIAMGSGYKEGIGSFHGHSPAPGEYRGFVNGSGVKIYYDILCRGEITRQRFINGMITFDLAGNRAETVLSFSLVSENEAAERMAEALESGFDGSRSKAAALWEELLGKINVQFKKEEDTRLFYSALYHSLVKPADTGHGFTDFVTMWDIYRTQLPLVMMIAPEIAGKILWTMLDTIRERGYFPCCHMMSCQAARHDIQATALSIYSISDGFFRSILSKEDYPVIKEAFVKVFASASLKGKSPTHTLDLAGAYYAASLVAEACEDRENSALWREKSRIWESVYDPETGLLTAKADYYEGDWWNYSFRPHADMLKRVALAGGEEGFEKLLDKFFGFECQDEYSCPRPLIPHRFEGMNNESDMETPAAYLWCGKADKQALIHDTIRKNMFLNGSGGCPGNNDSGALSSWYILSTLGIYPLTGTPYTLLTSPLVEKAQIDLGGRKLLIEVEKEGSSAIYPAEFEFNGEKFTEPWITTGLLHEGGVLKFVLKNKPASKSPVPQWL